LRSEGDDLDFAHDRIREITYAQTLPAVRKRLHAGVGATQFSRAEVWDKAVDYLRRAGAQALARSAYREAEACFEQALAGLAHLGDDEALLAQAIDVRLEVRAAILPFGKLKRLETLMDEAQAAAERLGDARRLGQVLCSQTYRHWLGGEYTRAAESGHRALALADDIDDVALRNEAALRVAHVRHTLGDFRGARALLEPIVVSSVKPHVWGTTSVFGQILPRYWLSMALTELGDLTEAERLTREALRFAVQARHAYSAIPASMGVATVLLRRGDAAGAIPLLEHALAFGDREDYQIWREGLVAVLVCAYAHVGRSADVTRLIEEADAIGTAAGATRRRSRSLVAFAEASLACEAWSGAAAFARATIELAEPRGERGTVARAQRVLAEVAARSAKGAAGAEALYTDAIATTRELGARPLEAECRLGRAKLYQALDKRAGARRRRCRDRAVPGDGAARARSRAPRDGARLERAGQRRFSKISVCSQLPNGPSTSESTPRATPVPRSPACVSAASRIHGARGMRQKTNGLHARTCGGTGRLASGPSAGGVRDAVGGVDAGSVFRNTAVHRAT